MGYDVSCQFVDRGGPLRLPTARCTTRSHRAQAPRRADVIQPAHHIPGSLEQPVSLAQVEASPLAHSLCPGAGQRLD